MLQVINSMFVLCSSYRRFPRLVLLHGGLFDTVSFFPYLFSICGFGTPDFSEMMQSFWLWGKASIKEARP